MNKKLPDIKDYISKHYLFSSYSESSTKHKVEFFILNRDGVDIEQICAYRPGEKCGDNGPLFERTSEELFVSEKQADFDYLSECLYDIVRLHCAPHLVEFKQCICPDGVLDIDRYLADCPDIELPF